MQKQSHPPLLVLQHLVFVFHPSPDLGQQAYNLPALFFMYNMKTYGAVTGCKGPGNAPSTQSDVQIDSVKDLGMGGDPGLSRLTVTS